MAICIDRESDSLASCFLEDRIYTHHKIQSGNISQNVETGQQEDYFEHPNIEDVPVLNLAHANFINEYLIALHLNNIMFTRWLENQGLEATSVSGSRLDCFIISLIQHATGKYGQRSFRDSQDIRNKILEKYPSQSGMLHPDNEVARFVLDKINERYNVNLCAYVLQANSDGLPFIYHRIGQSSKESDCVYIWQKGRHFVAITRQKEECSNTIIRTAGSEKKALKEGILSTIDLVVEEIKLTGTDGSHLGLFSELKKEILNYLGYVESDNSLSEPSLSLMREIINNEFNKEETNLAHLLDRLKRELLEYEKEYNLFIPRTREHFRLLTEVSENPEDTLFYADLACEVGQTERAIKLFDGRILNRKELLLTAISIAPNHENTALNFYNLGTLISSQELVVLDNFQERLNKQDLFMKAIALGCKYCETSFAFLAVLLGPDETLLLNDEEKNASELFSLAKQKDANYLKNWENAGNFCLELGGEHVASAIKFYDRLILEKGSLGHRIPNELRYKVIVALLGSYDQTSNWDEIVDLVRVQVSNLRQDEEIGFGIMLLLEMLDKSPDNLSFVTDLNQVINEMANELVDPGIKKNLFERIANKRYILSRKQDILTAVAKEENA